MNPAVAAGKRLFKSKLYAYALERTIMARHRNRPEGRVAAIPNRRNPRPCKVNLEAAREFGFNPEVVHPKPKPLQRPPFSSGRAGRAR